MLADSSDDNCPLEIDILIGSDHYWDTVTGEVRRGQIDPVAIHTELGWVLSGSTESTTEDEPSTSLVTHILGVDRLISEDTKQLEDCCYEASLRTFKNIQELINLFH